MTYREAKKLKPNDEVQFIGAYHERPLPPETCKIIATNDNRTVKPAVIEITIDSNAMGRVTRPHTQFNKPPIYIDTAVFGFDELLQEVGYYE